MSKSKSNLKHTFFNPLLKKEAKPVNFPYERQDITNNYLLFLLKKLEEYPVYFENMTAFCTQVGTLNTNRSHFNYSRALAVHLLLQMQESCIADFIQMLNQFIGNPYGINKGINLLNDIRIPIAAFGIELYFLRFSINLVLMTKHMALAALNEESSSSKILIQELEKRGFAMISDLAWGIVMLITTYNNFFHLADSAISPIFLTFLIFDALVFLAQWYVEATHYYNRLNELIDQKSKTSDMEHDVIQRQIDVLNDEWNAQCAYYAINILGAHILAVSFAITMLCTGPLALAGLALFSMLGNALYNTSEEYKKYQQALIAQKRELSNGRIMNDSHHQKLSKLLDEERRQNYSQFWQMLAFNIGGMAFIITAAAACWPVALGLTVAYTGYQLNKNCQKQFDTQEKPSHDIYRLFKNTSPSEDSTNDSNELNCI